MVIHIQGLVKAARWAEARLRDGISDDARATFLDTVGRRLAEASEILRLHHAHPDRLPAPSRRAFTVLTKIAATAPHAFPDPLPRWEAAPPVRVRHVVRSLSTCQAVLAAARGVADVEAIEAARRMAEDAAYVVETSCEDAGSRPAGLHLRSRSAYAMLCWLAEYEHAACYVRGVQNAIEGLSTGLGRARGVERPTVTVEFGLRQAFWSVRRVEQGVLWRLSAGFLAGEPADFARLANVTDPHAPTSELTRRTHEAFLASDGFRSILLELDWLVESETYRVRGRAWHLDELYERLDRTHLNGAIVRPSLTWWPTLSERIFGLYIPTRDLVCISTRLDDIAVPEFVAEVVLYHELLHKKHPAVFVGGRRRSHTWALKSDERRHPKFLESERWLAALVAGEDAPSPPVVRRTRLAVTGPALTPSGPVPLPADNGRDRMPILPPHSASPRLERGDPCPCGSGKRHIRCCRPSTG